MFASSSSQMKCTIYKCIRLHFYWSRDLPNGPIFVLQVHNIIIGGKKQWYHYNSNLFTCSLSRFSYSENDPNCCISVTLPCLHTTMECNVFSQKWTALHVFTLISTSKKNGVERSYLNLMSTFYYFYHYTKRNICFFDTMFCAMACCLHG